MEKSRTKEILCALDAKGHIFSGFEIEKLNNQLCVLGTGGFSSVYGMKSLQRPDKKYALKVIGFEKHVMTSENFKATANLQYELSEKTPYICRVIALKEIRVVLDEEGEIKEVTEALSERWKEDGIHLQFMLMERLENIVEKDRFGKVWLNREELSREENVINFAFQIGDVLQKAHGMKVLHRDIKLENIFWDEDAECYKLGDFGIAKCTAEGTTETVVYTDGYGAPEIERHLSDYYNATADIYSLGITLYLLLNDLRFPGSEGYYVNMVQYSPEFVLPAPKNGSKGMARILRKMCQYYKEDRYQSIEEVLMDLTALKLREKEVEEECNLPDFETMTYKEEHFTEEVVRGGIRGRAKRKEEERIADIKYSKSSGWYLVGFTLLMTLLMRGLHNDVSAISSWQFWVVPAMGLLTGIPVVAGSSVVSVLLWAVLMSIEKLQWLQFIGKYDLSWILLVIWFFMIFCYKNIRFRFKKTTILRGNIGKITFDYMFFVMVIVGVVFLLLERFAGIEIPEIIKNIHLVRTGAATFAVLSIVAVCKMTKEKTNEEHMDEGSDGEHSDTTE